MKPIARLSKIVEGWGYPPIAHPEAGFFAGMKSYGRAPTFLLATGHEQVRSIAAALTGDWEAAARVELELPETGVCSTRPVQRAAALACRRHRTQLWRRHRAHHHRPRHVSYSDRPAAPVTIISHCKVRTAGVGCTDRARSSHRAAVSASPSTSMRIAVTARTRPRCSTSWTLPRSARHRRQTLAPFRLARQIGQTCIVSSFEVE
jgi:hypothetical protein